MRNRFLRGLLAVAALLSNQIAHADGPAVAEPLSLVNPMQGTDSNRDFSHGNTLPLVGEPWSMTDWSIQNRGGITERWFYQSTNNRFFGFRATHSPCPWAGDYGHFMVCPQVGPVVMAANEFAADYDPAHTIIRPDYVRIELKKYHLTAELTAAARSSVIRLRFNPADKTGRLLFDLAGDAQLSVQGNRVSGYTKYHTGMAAGDFHCWFVGELDRPIGGSKTVGNETTAGKGMGYVEFDITKPVVEIKLATSFISLEQAWRNLKTETRGGFDAVQSRTATAWQEHLSKISIDGTPEQRTTFYTCFYRAMTFPHRFFELDAAGKPIHYSPWDGKVHPGPEYVDSGLWDTYRTQFPLLSIVDPQQLGEMVEGWINAYREGGWLPQWPNPGGYRAMPGSHADAMIVDAMSKGIEGFDYKTAYAALRRDAFDISPRRQPYGRPHLQDYLDLGFVPSRTVEYWISNSLDYAYDDWCVAQAAKLMHQDADYQQLMKRCQNYRKLWDPQVKFFRGKTGKGEWADDPFDEFAWGGGYAESGPWQTFGAVPHDSAGVAELAGGTDAFRALLDKLFDQPSVFHVGAYRNEIHEMTEFAAANMGQFAVNNQPGFGLPYLYATVGQPWKTERWTRRACDTLFNSGPDGYPGDEDNGSMASWYILSSIGIYPLTPGQPTYVLTSPAYKSVKINLSKGKTFTITADGNSVKNVYVQSRTLNGQPYSSTWISQSQITAGGVLNDKMSESPAERVVGAAELPYSASIEAKQ